MNGLSSRSQSAKRRLMNRKTQRRKCVAKRQILRNRRHTQDQKRQKVCAKKLGRGLKG